MPQSSNVRNFKAHAAVICSNLFLACNYNLVKTISPAFIGPFALNVLRVGVSIALFWTIWCFSGTRAGFAKKDWLRFILCALTGVVINQLLFIKGMFARKYISKVLPAKGKRGGGKTPNHFIDAFTIEK